MASTCLSLVMLICVSCLAIQVSSIHTLKQGDHLNSSSQLVSPNGNFTLRFYTLQDTNNSYLAAWFTDDITTDYPVWIGNREKPIPTNSSPVLSLGSRGELIITHGRGESIELYAGGSGRNVTATLLNTGNFVVNHSKAEFLWQSFDHPTDTLLPGMRLGVDKRTGKNRTLSSWFGQTDPAIGAFTLEYDPGVRQLLVRRRGVVYWRSGELKDAYNDSNVRLKKFENTIRPDALNFNYNLTIVTSDEGDYFMYSLLQKTVQSFQPGEYRNIISGWRMEYLGDITDRSAGRFALIATPSLCYGFKSNDSYDNHGSKTHDSGCESSEQPKCRNNNMTFVLKSGDFWQVDGGGAAPSIDNDSSSLSLSDCREMCWSDCECVGYADRTVSGCQLWRGKNLEFEQSVDGTATLKYVLDPAPAPSRKGSKKHVQIIPIVIGSLLLLILCIALFVIRKFLQGKRDEDIQRLLTLDGYTEDHDLRNGGPNRHELKLFTYASIQSATRNFSPENKLGEGGFGPVYKGRTAEGQEIAVKVLSRQSGQGLLEFKTELVLISKLQHVNLVKLIGFCVHGDDKMIIYDYMHNKSLDFFLFDPSKREQLDWQKRFNIIEGTAQGLLYLHKYSRLKIIHRDLKPNNILLDENMNPKISDFGLARIFKQNASEANTNRRVGTYGYMAPEYAMQGVFSVKSDIYSFGVLVLEIVSGRKNNSFHQIEGPLDLVEYAWELWRKDSALELMDPTLRDSCVIDQLQRCIHIALLCAENNAADRPNIEDVKLMLKNETTMLRKPKNPAFITRNSVVEGVEKSKISANEVTISEMGGR